MPGGGVYEDTQPLKVPQSQHFATNPGSQPGLSMLMLSVVFPFLSLKGPEKKRQDALAQPH